MIRPARRLPSALRCTSALIACVGISLSLGLTSHVRADLDKEEIKKKANAEAEPSLGDPNDGDFHKTLAKKGEENLREINRLLEDVQNNLANKKTGGDTQKKQQQATQRLEQLIEELAKAAAQMSGSSGAQQQQQQQQPGQPDAQQPRQNQKQQRADRMQQKKSQQEQNDQQNRNDQRREGVPPPEGNAKSLTDRVGKARKWGILPPKFTEALFASDQDAPAEYREILSRFYKRMNESYERHGDSK